MTAAVASLMKSPAWGKEFKAFLKRHIARERYLISYLYPGSLFMPTDDSAKLRWNQSAASRSFLYQWTYKLLANNAVLKTRVFCSLVAFGIIRRKYVEGRFSWCFLYRTEHMNAAMHGKIYEKIIINKKCKHDKSVKYFLSVKKKIRVV